jgi:hypothetical protein
LYTTMSFGRRARPSVYMPRALDPIVCDADGLAADAATLDALARIALVAGRHGLELRLCGASPQLCAVIDLAGLAEVLLVEDERSAEQREQRLRVEEERHLDDGAV